MATKVIVLEYDDVTHATEFAALISAGATNHGYGVAFNDGVNGAFYGNGCLDYSGNYYQYGIIPYGALAGFELNNGDLGILVMDNNFVHNPVLGNSGTMLSVNFQDGFYATGDLIYDGATYSVGLYDSGIVYDAGILGWNATAESTYAVTDGVLQYDENVSKYVISALTDMGTVPWLLGYAAAPPPSDILGSGLL
jgi:hypothetical protein